MENVLSILTNGEVTTKDGRKFTRIVGGFNQDNPSMTTKQMAELLDKELKHVNEVINNNINYFEFGLDIIDLKVVGQTDYNLEVLKSLGYSNMSISKAKNIYILSQSGFLLYLKFAEGEKAVELYKDFIEDYFKTKAENKVMKQTLEEELEFLKNEKKMALGEMFMEQDENKKMEYFNKNERISSRIKEIELSLNEKEIMNKLKPKISIADKFIESNAEWDIGVFSKIVNIKGLGRNNMFEWMRNKKILMSNNTPYQKYMDYFKIVSTKNTYTGEVFNKTVVKAKGVEFMFKKLLEDGKIIAKPIEQVMQELSGINNNN